MNKVHKIILISLITIISIIFSLFFINQQPQKPISIEPIKIEPLQIKTEAKVTPPSDILLKFKQATAQATLNSQPKTEEVAEKILKTLKEKTAIENKETLVMKQKKEINKPAINKKVIHKKENKTSITKVKSKTNKKIKITKKSKTTKKVKVVKNTQKNKPKIATPKIDKASPTSHMNPKEVQAHKNKYANKVKSIEASKNFEIKETKNNLPDAYYFKDEQIPNKTLSSTTEPIGYVKTLGVVDVSNEYEVNFDISKKVEVAQEGIVDISTATTETEELKKLQFVNTLGVVEVSDEFETIEAKKHLP